MSALPESPDPGPASILDQYKAYLQDLGNIGTRNTTSNGFYLSVLTALLGLLALVKPSEGLSDMRGALRVVVPFFALLLCWAWHQTMRFYAALFKVKFEVLRELEVQGGLYPIFERERQLWRSGTWLYRYEHWIPVLLGLPFLAILLCALWTLAKHGS